MKKMGRPKVVVNDADFDTVIQLPLTKEDMAKVLKCSDTHLDTYCKQRFGQTFLVLKEQNRQNFKKNIIGKQYELAMKGDRTMLIWLGKQYCEQTDKTEISGSSNQPIQIAYVPKSKRVA